MMDAKKEFKTKQMICSIDTIIGDKIKNLNGYGFRRANATLEEIYRLNDHKAPGIEIFDKMAKLCWMLREYTSKMKGEQQQLFIYEEKINDRREKT